MNKLLMSFVLAMFCLLQGRVHGQRTIRVYNFSPMKYFKSYGTSAELNEFVPYLVELPSKQAFGFSRASNWDRPRGFAILNFDSVIVLKIRFIDNVYRRADTGVFGNGDACFDTSVTLHPDSITYNDIELFKTVQNGKAWLQPQDARNNKRMWQRQNRTLWILTYDAREKWAKVHKWAPMITTINFDCRKPKG